MLTTYTQFQNEVSSEKIVLARLSASKRLMAWVLHSGSVYKLTNFDVPIIESIEDSGTAYTEVSSLAAVSSTAKFYNDRTNKILYIRATGSSNPNSRFLVMTRKLFFANVPITLPHDLSTGEDVYWEPTISSNSEFGVSTDTINQMSEAISGKGSLTLINDQSFWPAFFNKHVLENKLVEIYSYHRDLDPSQAKLLFRGTVDKIGYKERSIQISLLDQIAALDATIDIPLIGALSSRSKDDLYFAKQRMIFGRVSGHRPVNVDEVLDGYPITGVVSITAGGATVSGSGTNFLAEISPGDKLIIEGVEYVVSLITSDTNLTLTENYNSVTTLNNVTITLIPDKPKRWINREWKVSGYPTHQPTTTTQAGSTIIRLVVGSTLHMYDGDIIYVGTYGSGEVAEIDQVVSGTLIQLRTSLAAIPSAGTTVFKPGVQDVRLGDVLLRYDRDYTFNATTSVLTLRDTAEANSSPIFTMANNLVFNSTRTVTGTGLDVLLKPGSLISAFGHVDYFEVSSIDSDTQVTLRSAATFTGTSKGLYKNYIFDPSNEVLTCSVFGRTDDATPSGTLLNTVPSIVEQLLIDAGLSNIIDTASFTEAKDLVYDEVGIVIPTEYSDTNSPTYKSVINKLNKSVLGSVSQGENFNLYYNVIQPHKTQSLILREEDILKLDTISIGAKTVNIVKVRYNNIEHNYLIGDKSFGIVNTTSDFATYVLETANERVIDSNLVDESGAQRLCDRWSLLLERATNQFKIDTKLQAASIQVGDIIQINHSKLFERYGSSSKAVLVLVESIAKTGYGVSITAVDLSGTLTSVAAITSSTNTWTDATDDERLSTGYITDQYGIINDDANSFGVNVIW